MNPYINAFLIQYICTQYCKPAIPQLHHKGAPTVKGSEERGEKAAGSCKQQQQHGKRGSL